MKILSIALMAISVFLGLRHGYDALRPASTAQAQMMAALGIGPSAAPYLGVVSILTALLLLFPRTFVLGNILSAIAIVLVMALSLHAGNYKMALLEIPFLALPLLLIWLRYPL